MSDDKKVYRLLQKLTTLEQDDVRFLDECEEQEATIERMLEVACVEGIARALNELGDSRLSDAVDAWGVEVREYAIELTDRRDLVQRMPMPYAAREILQMQASSTYWGSVAIASKELGNTCTTILKNWPMGRLIEALEKL